LLNDEDISKWLGGRRSIDDIARAIETERQHWQEHGFGPWVVIEPSSGEVVARGGLRHAQVRDHDEVELFFAVSPLLWGKGLATALAQAALELAFVHLRLLSVVSFTTHANRASQRVLQKLQFTQEAVFEHAGMPHILFRRLSPT
jgi:RimJ/RimL family protein N-acetyltransferase